MIVFLDTSALLKLYREEEGSAQVEREVNNANVIYLSTLAELEFRSSVWKHCRTKEISEGQVAIAVEAFVKDYSEYTFIEMSDEIISSAEKLLMKYGNDGLRTLDSIQLASALTLRDENCLFLTYDKKLKKMLQKEDLDVL